MSPADDGLARAAALFLQRAQQPDPEPVAAFLARHGELREWLEPMFDAEAAAGGEAAPARLGPYRLLREIGRGGMGVVYAARHQDGGPVLALKVLAGFQALQPARAERFRREAALAARLAHPGLVHVVDAGAVDGALYLAMEFVVGAPLDAVLRQLQGRDPAALTAADLGAAVQANLHLPPDAAAPAVAAERFDGSYTAAVVRLAVQLAEALQHLHAAGVVHRDVKPSNALLAADGRLVLTDFGLARDAADPSLTLTGDFAGTPNYVSPEQAMAKRVAVDARSDLFALGSTLYELLTLQKAFPGDSLPEVFGRILHKDPVPPARWHRGLAPDLASVVGKLLEKDPDRRYRDAAALRADLQAFLAYRPVAAQRASLAVRTARWARREPWRAALAAVLALVVPAGAAAAGYLWARAGEIEVGRAQIRRAQVEALVDEAFAAAADEDRGTATARFEQALALDPTCQEAILGLVLTEVRRAGAPPALALLEQRFPSALPDGLQTCLRYALLQRAGDPRAASAALPAPQTPFELFVAASLDQAAGADFAMTPLEAIERAVLASDRPRLWLHQHWASLADEQRDTASGRRCAANLLANWPAMPSARYFAALALRRADPERALAVAAAAAGPADGRAAWAMAMVHEIRGDLPAAIAALARAAALLPRSPAAHYALGRLHYQAGEHAAALAAMQRSRDLEPSFAEAWLGIGMAERQLGHPELALAALRHAVDLHGSHAEARFQLGQQLVQAGQLAEALPHLRRAAGSSQTDPNKWHHVAFAAFQTGNEEEGAAALRRAVAVRPGYERGHLALASYLDQRGKAAELRQALAAWTEALPGSVEGWLQFGRHCVRSDVGKELQDLAAAAWAARRALALSGERHASAWLLLGEAQAGLGLRDTARDALQRALAAEPPLGDDERAHATRLLEALGG